MDPMPLLLLFFVLTSYQTARAAPIAATVVGPCGDNTLFADDSSISKAQLEKYKVLHPDNVKRPIHWYNDSNTIAENESALKRIIALKVGAPKELLPMIVRAETLTFGWIEIQKSEAAYKKSGDPRDLRRPFGAIKPAEICKSSLSNAGPIDLTGWHNCVNHAVHQTADSSHDLPEVKQWDQFIKKFHIREQFNETEGCD